MITTRYLDSSQARTNFFDILASVYRTNKTYIIKKSGIPVAQICALTSNTPPQSIMKYAGILSKAEGSKLLKAVRSGRRDGSALKKKLCS